MAKEPKKNQVQNIIENLLNSEIPELQSVAHELTSWTKELEKHSWKLQHVASELETLMSTQGGAEAPTESNIVELLRNNSQISCIIQAYFNNFHNFRISVKINELLLNIDHQLK